MKGKVNSKSSNYALRYIVWTYLVFWAMVLGIGGLASVLGATPFLMRWVVVICSWAPTFVILPMIKKIYSGATIKEFYKKAFGQKLNIVMVLVTTIIIVGIFVLSTFLVSRTNEVSFASLFDLSAPTILLGVLFSIIQGATGEESGWRGFLQPHFEEKYGVIMGSLFVGIVWTFFHMPLWFVSVGYTGLELVEYIILFCVAIISFGVIMGICHHRCRNLFLAIWMHFTFNFVLVSYIGNIIFIMKWFALLYLLTAVGFTIWFIITEKNKI